MNSVRILPPVLEVSMAKTGSLEVSLSCFCVFLHGCAFCQRHMFVQGISGADSCLSIGINVSLVVFAERRICAVTWVVGVHLALEV